MTRWLAGLTFSVVMMATGLTYAAARTPESAVGKTMRSPICDGSNCYIEGAGCETCPYPYNDWCKYNGQYLYCDCEADDPTSTWCWNCNWGVWKNNENCSPN